MDLALRGDVQCGEGYFGRGGAELCVVSMRETRSGGRWLTILMGV